MSARSNDDSDRSGYANPAPLGLMGFGGFAFTKRVIFGSLMLLIVLNEAYGRKVLPL